MLRIYSMLSGYRDVLRRNILIFSITSIILGVTSAFNSWFFPILVYRYGASELVLAIFTISNAIAIIPNLAGGVLSDVVGRKSVVLISTSMYLIAFIALLPGHVYGLFIAGVLAISSSAMIYPAVTSLIGESVEEDKVAKAFSLTLLASTLGFSVGSAVLGYVVAYFGVYELILLCVMLTGISLILRSMLVETKKAVSTHLSRC